MLGLLIRDKFNLEHFCGAPFVLSSCGHCYKEGEHPNVCLSVSVSVSVWEGGDSWLREVTGKHGSSFLPSSGPGVWSVKCGV